MSHTARQHRFGALLALALLFPFALGTQLSSAAVTDEDKALARFLSDAIQSREKDFTNELLSLVDDDSKDVQAWAGLSPALAGDKRLIKALNGSIQVSDADLAKARKAAQQLRSQIEKYRAVPAPREYILPRGTVPDLQQTSDLETLMDTQKAPGLTVGMNIGYPRTKPESRMPGRCVMRWSDAGLHLVYSVDDPTPYSKSSKRDTEVFDDDCVELFIIVADNPQHYWELNIGRNGAIRDVTVTKTAGRWFGKLDNDATLKGLVYKVQERPATATRPAGYTVAATVPWADLMPAGQAPAPGSSLRFTVGFCDMTAVPDGRPKQTYYSNIYTFVGYHDLGRYDTMKLQP